MKSPQEKLVVAISSRALFNLDESHAVFENDGVESYCRYQVEHEDIALEPGVAFSLVKKLLALNERDPCNPRVEVILLSRNSADTGLRIFNSIKHHGLGISRAAFTRGESTHPYISAFGAHLFLSAEPGDVRKALEAGFAAATILPSAAAPMVESNPSQLRIAFDGDAVSFSDDSERIYKQNGLGAFESNEILSAKQPLPGGPFNLETLVGRSGVCGFWGAGQGARTRNGSSIPRGCNATMRRTNRAIHPVADSPIG